MSVMWFSVLFLVWVGCFLDFYPNEELVWVMEQFG
jgi:hypothetical protein